MRRITSLCIVVLSLIAAAATLDVVADAQERASLSQWVGNLLKSRKRPSGTGRDEAVEPASGWTARRPEPNSPEQEVAGDGPAEAAEPVTDLGDTSTELEIRYRKPPRFLSRKRTADKPAADQATGIPYPPLPPAVQPSWVHPPVAQIQESLTAAEALAMTRTAMLAKPLPKPLPDMPETEAWRSVSLANAEFSLDPATPGADSRSPASEVQQVMHVGALPIDAPGSLQVDSPADGERADRQESDPREVDFQETATLETATLETADLVTDGPERNGQPVAPAASVVAGPLGNSEALHEDGHRHPARRPRFLRPTVIGNLPAEVGKSAAIGKTVGERAATALETLAEPLDVVVEEVGEAPSREVVEPVSQPEVAPVYRKVAGRVGAVDGKSGIVRVDLAEKDVLPAGTKIRVYHESASGERRAVHVRVLDSVPGVAAAKLVAGEPTDVIAPGDATVAWKTANEQP